MNIFFDTDYTILGADGTLRPNTREVMQQVKYDGHTLYVWSGVGIRWADVRRHNLESLITNCFWKPVRRFAEDLRCLGLPILPDMVIDDDPEVPAALGGIWVRPYFSHSNNDHEMERVYQLITEYGRNTIRRERNRGDLGTQFP